MSIIYLHKITIVDIIYNKEDLNKIVEPDQSNAVKVNEDIDKIIKKIEDEDVSDDQFFDDFFFDD